MRHIFKVVISVFVLISNSFSSQPDEFCGMQASAGSSSQLGGRYKPASGTFKVLVIYAQFSDDKTDTTNTNWVKGQAPAFMTGTIDETWSSTPTSGSMTHYFNSMSFNQFKIIGKEVSITMPQTMAYYYNNFLRSTYDMNKIAIQTADAQVNYADFDNWRYDSEFNHTNTSDGIVDMIFVVWRNKNDTIGLWSGLGHLNGSTANYSPFTVESGTKTIQTGYYGYGSGITIINGHYGTWWTYRGMQHELAHWFFGDNDHHSTLGTWALLDGWGTPSGCINAYERYKLGWMNFNTIDPASYGSPTTVNITLSDFVTTGVAYRIKVPGGGTNEYYILENHQRISQFDVPDNNTSATGVFVLHQTADIGGAVYVNSAEGKFNWTTPESLQTIYGGTQYLPVFLRGSSNRISGYSKRQNIPWTRSNGGVTPTAIHYYRNPAGTLIQAPPTIFTGNGKDQFDLSNNVLFSPASNPSSVVYTSASDSIAFEITGISNGVITLNIHVNNPEAASPAKPMDLAFSSTTPVTLSWTNNGEPDRQYWEVWRKWYRSRFAQEDWTLRGTTNTNSFQDLDFTNNPATNNTSVWYKIRTKDTQGKYSLFTDNISLSATQQYWKSGKLEKDNVPGVFSLQPNYPNPFNPTTTIGFTLEKTGMTTLKVYDAIGREVATLVNEVLDAGVYHQKQFNASKLASGIYFARLVSDGKVQIKKLMLMK